MADVPVEGLMDPLAGDEALARELCPESPLDLGIARAVQVLRDYGVETYESCQGGDGHVVLHPMVRFHGTQACGWRALTAAGHHGLPVFTLARVWDVIDGEPVGPVWEMTFRRWAS